MKKFKMLALTTVVGTSFVAGQIFAPTAGTAEPGSIDDPVVSESLLNQELGKLKKEITSLKSTITTLEGEVKKLSSNSGSSSSGSSNSGSSNSGSSNSGSSNSGSSSSSTSSIGTAVVTANSLNVRSGAGTNYSKVGEVTKGTKVTLLKKSGSWYQIKSGSITGWVSGDYLNVTLNSSSSGGSSSTTKTGTVTANSLNVRSGAGTNYSKVGALSKGTKVTILKTSGSWYQIKSGSITGWVSAEYIKVN